MSSIEDIDAQIKALKALKRSMNKKARPAKIKKEQVSRPVRHTRQVVCTNCGISGSRNDMIQISKHEYQHPLCPARVTRVVRIEFN